MTEPGRDEPRRDKFVTLGLAVSATSAAVSSFTSLQGLAVASGWPGLLAPLLPLAVDAYGMTATRVWLAGSTRSGRAKRFARANTLGAIGLSLMGNAVFHLVAAGLVAITWVVVVAVGAVPPLVLGAVAQLAILRTQAAPITPPVDLSPSPVRTGDGLSYRSEDELIAAARVADAAHRASHGGRPMSRDALRQTLQVGGTRATALARRLKDERLQSASSSVVKD